MINRAPIYSDIGRLSLYDIAHRRSLNYTTVVRIQAGLNVAIPAASLCINRRLYKIATAKVVMVTRSDNRRAVIIDLLIGIGIPILQMIMRECHQLFTLHRSFILARCRVRRFGTPLPHIRRFWPLSLPCARATDFLPLLRMACGDRLRISRLLR